MLIDFTSCEKKKKKYESANGNKISVVYNGELYMLKFPPVSKRNKMLSYKNDCISEYIACHVLQSIGLNVQQTLLGTYNVNGKEKIVVACKDFTDAEWNLIPFAGLKNETIYTPTEGYNTDLGEIIATFNAQTDFPCACHFERNEARSRNLFPQWRNPFRETDLSASVEVTHAKQREVTYNAM